VAAIGLDGAEWPLIESLMAEGELPHLSALRARSALAELSDPDYRTGLIWEHFLTGKGAAANGRLAAVEFRPDTYEVWQVGGRRIPPFYARSATMDDPPRVIVFDVPYVTLTGEVDGVEITTWGGHDPGFVRASRPPGILRQIDRIFGPHPALGNELAEWYQDRPLDAMADGFVIGARRSADVALWLQRRFGDWDLFLTVMPEPHGAGEKLWHGISALRGESDYPPSWAPNAAHAGYRLREIYRTIDDAVGRITAALDDDSYLVVFSLNGTGENHADLPSMVFLPELLHRLEFGRPLLGQPDQEAWKEAGHPVVVPEEAGWYEFMHQYFPARGIRGRARETTKRVMPPSLRALVRNLRSLRRHPPAGAMIGAMGEVIPGEADLAQMSDDVHRTSLSWQIPSLYRPHWPNMRAFALPSFYDGRIRINLAGRERSGVVPLSEYDRVCGEVEEALRACRNPRTGKEVLAEVLRVRAGDPMAPDGPESDLQVVWTGAADAVEHPTAGMIGPFPFRRSGGHTPTGFAFVSGPGIAPQHLGSRSSRDVTPTILSILGRRIPPDFEGQPLLGSSLRSVP
jgi:predicted AlkP superfamily phosphohydrolase/phosphomutase